MARGRIAGVVLLAAGVVVLLVGLVAVVVAPPDAEAGEPTPTDPTSISSGVPTETPTDDPTRVDDVVLRWGVNDESNTAAYAPGTYNFLGAGRVRANDGRPIERSAWRARSGAVSVEKWHAATREWRTATWAGLRTDTSEAPLTIGRSSGHTLVFAGGTGTLDPEDGTATIAWDGDATVLYYSGQSMFYLSDPELQVADGAGALTATVEGFASSRDRPGTWEPVPPERVTVAVLPDVDLGDPRGFAAEPAYRRVEVAVPDGVQVREGADWGAFPQDFVTYMAGLGTAGFWYSSGGAADPHKVPLPLTVSLDPADPVEPTPTVDPTATPSATPSNGASDPPTAAPPPKAPAASGAVAPSLPAGAAADPLALPARPVTDLRLTAAAPGSAAGATRAAAWPWWSGAGLLLLAAAALLMTPWRRT